VNDNYSGKLNQCLTTLGNVTDIDAVKGQLKGKADRFPYGSEKNKKVT
jgi:hypothetical protein